MEAKQDINITSGVQKRVASYILLIYILVQFIIVLG